MKRICLELLQHPDGTWEAMVLLGNRIIASCNGAPNEAEATRTVLKFWLAAVPDGTAPR